MRHFVTEKSKIMKTKTLLFFIIAAGVLPCGCGSANSTDTSDERSVQEIMFDDGNYAMFIHFGLYSKLEGEWKGKTYYGNAEWIMNENQAGIPAEEYMAEAATFDPDEFDAEEIVSIAKDAGMKYIIITSKHHEGFAMFDSDVCDFNIADATPFHRDVIGELADACRRNGLGIGFYYSQFQDWTAPGGGCSEVDTDAEGHKVSFDDYFYGKCLPQVEEITTKYGELELIWFDTPGDMSEKHSRELYEAVKKNQPDALISSRIGNGIGDYETMGDMEVPLLNIEGRWEGIDVTQVGWGYSKLDNKWKTSEYILKTLISIIARGGTFMLNVGPDSHGRIAEQAADALRRAGEWVHRYPEVIYGAGASPWGRALPWGDAVTNDGKLYLVVFDWPADGVLWLPGLKNDIRTAGLYGGKKLKFFSDGEWTGIQLPPGAPEKVASVIEMTVEGPVDVVRKNYVDPQSVTTLPVLLADIRNAELRKSQWMEAFGEWKFKDNVYKITGDTRLTWTVDVKEPGFYEIASEYTGSGSYELAVEIDGKDAVRFSLTSGNRYEWFPIGWARVTESGPHEITLKVLGGDFENLSISSLSLTPVS